MRPKRSPRPRPPLDQTKLEELALSYLGRFATTRAKLRSYLARKVRERGWGGASQPDLEALAERYAKAGLIDDAAYALGKAQSLSRRGYGKRRLAATLANGGVEEGDRASANEHADAEAAASALQFARRRRIGPYADHPVLDRKEREKAVAAMVRAGHSLTMALTIVKIPPGTAISADDLTDPI